MKAILRMKCRHWLLLNLVVLFLAACAPQPQLRNDQFLNDTSLVSGEPCLAPCWQNITPGETPWGEAADMLSNSADFTNLDRERNRETGEEIYNFNYQDGPQCCRIYTRDGETLSSLLLMLAPQMALGEVIEQYGEPQFLSGQDTTDDQTFVLLVFPQTPMIVYAFGAGIEGGELRASSEVIGVVYMAPAEMGMFLSTDPLYTWDGYGPLSDLLAGEAAIQVPLSDNQQ